MASLADNLKSRRASELEHRGRPKIDLTRAKDSVGKLDRAVASLADLLPRMNEGGRLAYDETGNIVGGYDPEAQIEKAINWLMPMGSVAEAVDTGKGIAQGVLKTFGGVGAKTADRQALAAAEAMEKSGADMRDVWRQTGWYRAPWDGKWRWEIDDSKAMFTREPKLPFKGTKVGHFLSHEPLYDAYPDAARWHLNPSNPSLVGLKGQTSYGDMIDLNPEAGADTLQHEIQHAIQSKEGFAFGGTPQEAKRYKSESERKYKTAKGDLEVLRFASENGINDLTEAAHALRNLGYTVESGYKKRIGASSPNDLETKVNDALSEYLKYHDEFAWYKRLAGEAEARLVQDRLPLTAAQRREQYPLDGLAAMLAREGIDPGDNFSNLITRYGDGPAMSVEPDLSRLGIGAPELRAASDNSLAATLERMRARNLEKGLDEDMATGAVRDEIARRNGVAMLGLPEEHTARDRAGAMGYGGDFYHGTNVDVPGFDIGLAGTQKTKDWGNAAYVTPNPWNAESYAMDAATAKQKNDAFSKYEEVERQEAKKGWPGWGENDNVSAALQEYRAAARLAEQTPEGATIIPALLDARNAEKYMVSDGMTDPYLYQNLRMQDRGKDVALIYDNPDRMSEVAVYNPSRLRSRFAAFDPSRRDSANLLASLSGAAVLAPSLAAYLDRK